MALGIAAALPGASPVDVDALPPNVLIVLTDDQPFDSLPVRVGPPGMPWLEAQIADPTGHWLTFTNAFIGTPLCCPSRATILTGLTSAHTGVETNSDGFDLDESSTLATWLDEAGYTTGLVGKYLNRFPWDRGAYVPPGWDRFLAKQNQALDTTYYDYGLIDEGIVRAAGHAPSDYATTYLGNEASEFVKTAPRTSPWFLMFTPPAPHEPWIPAPGDAGTLAGQPVSRPGERLLNDVRGKPAWITALPEVTAEERKALIEARRRQRETLLEVDRFVEALLSEVAARGELDRTVVLVLTDNGYSFGEHRWTGKRCPYESCIRTPLVVRSPWASSATIDELVTNADLAPTVMDLVSDATGLDPMETDGRNLRSLLDGGVAPEPSPQGVLLQYAGDEQVPAWVGVHTRDFTLLHNADGTVELYDLTGALGPADPNQLDNRAGNVRFAEVQERLEGLLTSLVDRQGEG